MAATRAPAQFTRAEDPKRQESSRLASQDVNWFRNPTRVDQVACTLHGSFAKDTCLGSDIWFRRGIGDRYGHSNRVKAFTTDPSLT